MFAFTTLTVRVAEAGVSITFTRNDGPDVELAVPRGVPFKLALNPQDQPIVVPIDAGVDA